MSLNQAFSQFSEHLEKRLQLHRLLKEDEVRYEFFMALIRSEVCPQIDIALEVPHPKLRVKEIDTLIHPSDQRQQRYVFEFKFDKLPPNGQQNKTNRAGSVFNDLNRLALAQQVIPCEAYFIYLTDPSMAVYFKNKRNGLAAFYAPTDRFTVDDAFWQNRQSSFSTHVKSPGIDFSTSIVFQRALCGDFELSIFQVHRA
jgi:hypothetical protein